MRIAILDCGAGNLHSVRKAFAAVMPQAATLHIARTADDLAGATHLVLPGVGAFGDCMAGLNATGMRPALEEAVLHQKTPFLGICVGMQMLFERGHEHGVHEGLGWLPGEVSPIAPADASLRIPHMGWNQLQPTQPAHPFFAGVAPQDYAYFVHSFAAQTTQNDVILATVDYGGPIIAAVGRDNIVATQFHPEKSQRVGLALIQNFLGAPWP